MIGKTIGHYRITAKLGQGGMGEVFRAVDTRLNRDVALKLLPEMFTQDEQRMGRFSREAQLLASLNHPNIAQIYGIENVPGADGQDAGRQSPVSSLQPLASSPTPAAPDPKPQSINCLVMELVEGEDLSERIARGAIPLDEALPIALQIAEALENAHEKGIIHRDLKPANIKLTSEGKVKILDFGLAKALEDPVRGSQSASGLSQSPTLSMAATQAGIILGTAAYMSPEQARGKPVDRRADIWAFGVVLFEMLTGKQAFSGEDLSLTMANVMTREPNWESLSEAIQGTIRRLLERCLKKDPRSRLRDIGEARILLEDYLSDPGSAETSVDTAPGFEPVARRRQNLPWAFSGLLLVSLFTTLWILWPQPQPPEPPRRLVIESGVGSGLQSIPSGGAAVLSPDESMIVFTDRVEGGSIQLFLRRLDQLEAVPLPGTENALQAAFSPDGQWIAFRKGRELKKIAVTGGSAVTLCPTGPSRGVSWSEDGSIVLASGRNEGLSRVPGIGGTPEPITTLADGEATHRWPQLLPGGKAVLFTASSIDGEFDEARIVAQRLSGGERKVVWQGGYHGRYLPTGHLVYMHRGTLFAAPFNLDSLEIQGQPAPILEKVQSSTNTGFAGFTFSERGSLLYVEGEADSELFKLEWLDRAGAVHELSLQSADIRHFRISPSGKLLALEIQDGQQSDIWVYDISRDRLTRLTFDPGDDVSPVWSPSGRHIAFASSRNGVFNLYVKPADGSGDIQRLSESANEQFPDSWHPGGRYIGLFEFSPEDSWDIRIIELEGGEESGWKGKEVVTFMSSPYLDSRPQFSPDGNWLAYHSHESGRPEVYVRPFPGPGGKWQVSSLGGLYPRWSAQSQELYFEWGGQIFGSQYGVQGTSFLADRPFELEHASSAPRPNTRNYDVSPEGKVLVRRRPGEVGGAEGSDRLILFQNFFDYLKQQVPGR